MRSTHAIALSLVTLLAGASMPVHIAATITPNPNTTPAGTLRGGVFTLELEATEGQWPRDGGKFLRTNVEVFAERGKAPVMPGPLVRVPAGSVVRVALRNALTRPITFYLPTSPRTEDSVVVAAGATGQLEVRATKSGNYLYRAAASDTLSQQIRITGALAGAFIVDTAGPPQVHHDRVLMMLMMPDSGMIAVGSLARLGPNDVRRVAFTINGASWPNTERLAATAGDTLHWRVINATFDAHPMHMHGFYYRVDALTAARGDPGEGSADESGRMVVTERMPAFSGMSMTWIPERAGNWLFHCHVSIHLEPSEMIHDAHANHATTGMAGLVMGIEVAPRRGTVATTAPAAARRLRLVAFSDSGFADSLPSFRFAVEENGRRSVAHVGISPTLYLTRNEPVAITVVNQLHEATAVHWHGMELESYYDGVGGFSGAGSRLASVVAPGDSFVARFTPPRAGTFMYHSHVDDPRQQAAGLVGAMIVRDGAPVPKPDDFEIMIKGAVAGPVRDHRMEVNGQVNPDTLVAHVGKPARFRFMSLATNNVNTTVTLTARADSVTSLKQDSLLVRWIPVAKDGMDLPAAARGALVAKQIVSMGETYDFEFTPVSRGQQLRIEVRSAGGRLLTRVPVRVE